VGEKECVCLLVCVYYCRTPGPITLDLGHGFFVRSERFAMRSMQVSLIGALLTLAACTPCLLPPPRQQQGTVAGCECISECGASVDGLSPFLHRFVWFVR